MYKTMIKTKTKTLIAIALVVFSVASIAAGMIIITRKPISNIDPLVNHVLTVTKSGTGTGTVTSSPDGINCGSACSASLNANTQVTLTAAPAEGSTFAGWSGACSGTGTCKVTMTGAKNVTANFGGGGTAPDGVPLLQASDPNMWYGEAKGVQSVSSGSQKYYKFIVPSQCNMITVAWTTFDWRGQMDMLVRASSLPTIADWNNAVAGGYPVQSLTSPFWYNLFQASGDGGETVHMSLVSAGTYYIMMKNTRAETSQYKVWYTPSCDYVPRSCGDGVCQSNSENSTNCPQDCGGGGDAGQACSPSQNICTDTDGGNKSSVAGAVTTCTSTETGYKIMPWNDTCVESLQSGKNVAQSGILFEYYCDGTNFNSAIINCNCVNGACTGGSDPDPTSCTDSDGGHNYNILGTTIGTQSWDNVNGTQNDYCLSGSNKDLIEFYCGSDQKIGWEQYTCSNNCSNGICTGSTAGIQDVSNLHATSNSNGNITLAWNLSPSAGVTKQTITRECTGFSPCFSESFDISATATSYTFSNLTGDWKFKVVACTASDTCSPGTAAGANLTATVNGSSTTQYALSVSKSGTGSGTVSSSPSGISCGSSCSASFNANASVTLTAAPTTGSAFTGWSGACSGTGTCTVTMSAAKSVMANFDASSASIQDISNLHVTSNAGGSIALAWTRSPSAGITKQTISRECTGFSPCFYESFDISATTASYTFNNLTGDWKFKVVACNASGTCSPGTAAGSYLTATANVAATAIPLPTQVYDIPFVAAADPVISANPIQAKPIGLGAAISGSSITNVNVGANFVTNASFDAYLAITFSGDSNIYYYDGSQLVPSASLVKWRSGFSGNLSANIFSNLDLTTLANGTYTIYFGVSPANDTSKYYLWHTSFTNTKYGSSASSTCTDPDNTDITKFSSPLSGVFDHLPVYQATTDNSIYTPTTIESYTYTDTCVKYCIAYDTCSAVSSPYLLEYGCDGVVIYQCPKGCSNGACIQ